MPSKPSRNEPCWCGSGKKYKSCHWRQDQEEKASALAAPRADLKPPPTSPEQAAADAAWERFEQADVNDKIAIFVEKLDNKTLDDQDAFEMLTSIRDASDPRHDAAFRARFAEWVRRLRCELPEVYQKSMGYHIWNLVDDIIADQRWKALSEAFTGFAEVADKHLDSFEHIHEALLYHGQTQPLFDVMHAAWDRVRNSGKLFDWAIDEFSSELIKLVFYRYLETTAEPRADDPALVNALSVYGQPRLEWFEHAIQSLSAPAPTAWRVEDFQAVDAEQWEHNIDSLLFEFIADQHRQAGIPLSKGNMAREHLRGVLLQQFAEVPITSQAKPRGKKTKQKHAQRIVSAPLAPLVPQREILDRILAKDFHMLGSHPHKAGALIELTPAYLHFLARLGLIHPTELDQALNNLHPLAGMMPNILSRRGADVHLVQAVETAWSSTALDGLRNDPALETARAQLPIIQPPTEPAAAPQTFTFKVVYRQKPEAWFVIELRGNQTLDDLHDIILDAADFDEGHLYSFYMSGHAWDEATEYSRGPKARRSSHTKISNLPLRMKQRFLYLYDYGDQHEFDVQLVATSADAPGGQHPKIIEQHGKIPPQYGNWEEDELEIEGEAGENDWENDDE